MFGLSRRATFLLAALFICIGLLIFAGWAAEYLWFGALGFESVFLTVRALGVLSFVVAFVAALAYFWINFKVFASIGGLNPLFQAASAHLRAQSAMQQTVAVPPVGLLDVILSSPARARGMLTAVAVMLALVFGTVFYNQWDTLLRFWWSQPFAEVDPLFGHNIAFYLFELPLLELLQDSLIAASFIALLLLLIGYRYAGLLPADWGRLPQAPSKILWHLAGNLAVYLAALAWGLYLDRFELLQSARGAVYGAGYTDVHVVLPAIWIMIAVTLGIVPVLVMTRFRRPGRNMLSVPIGSYLALYLLILVIGPSTVQSFLVEPDELEREMPYLRHNIEFTRKAYKLDQVDIRSYEAYRELDSAALSRNQQTIDNIRVWDWKPLSDTFRQLQQIRTYYAFGDVDVDRYRFADADRQVMLAARELSESLPAKADTWVNRHLQYTHGYGLVVSLAAEKEAEGDPVLMVKDLPPQSGDGLTVTRPEIYYGENLPGYAIVATDVPEFNYPKGDRNVYARYSGRGGVRIDTLWKRLLFAWHRFDANIAITSYTTPDSRIQFWRNINERVQRLAPFLLLDKDPYLVLSGGRLFWIQDAYTVSALFPYSEPHERGFNYIRNSVKAVVNAYDGDVTFYVMDEEDPVLAVYRKALPDLFRSLDRMPDDLRRHVRYPQDLFEAQVSKYSTYHMTVPQVFYNGEDLWTAPREKYGGEIIDMKPYYVLVRLPGESELQFLLMTPLTPANRPNMIAWMAARSDFPNYGELLVYKLSKERLIRGPIQVEATIDQDTLISQQLSLWDQRGSRVIRGNLLIIPVDQSFIYVEPVYLIAEESGIPQLKRVIVSDGERLAMLPTLRESLDAVFGGQAGSRAPGSASREPDKLLEARKALAIAEEALRKSDWILFGQSMEKLKQLLGE